MGERERPVPLVEPVVIQTVFLAGVDCEDMGDGTVLFTGFVKQRNPMDSSLEHIIVARYIFTKETLLQAMLKTAKKVFGWSLTGEILSNRSWDQASTH